MTKRSDEKPDTVAASPGMLVLVSTPIGNLGDLSPRAAKTLSEADLVCCEDTRRTRGLLSHAGIGGKHLLSLHGHNEESRAEEVLERIGEGQTVALVSDAGTPSVSDPGARLVRRAAAAGVAVSAVPGPSALLAALVLSGMATERFCFEGFLPRRGTERSTRLEELRDEQRTVLIYEAPTRLSRTLCDLAEVCGNDRPVCVARELTKLHEEIWLGTLGEAAAEFAQREARGEIVIVIGGAMPRPRPSQTEIAEALTELFSAGESARDAASIVSEELGVGRRDAYALALSIRSSGGARQQRNGGGAAAVRGETGGERRT